MGKENKKAAGQADIRRKLRFFFRCCIAFDVQREMRKQLKRRLRVAGFGEDELDGLANQIVDLLKVRRAP